MSATIVVQFGQGADSSALVKVELDDLANIDADGNERTTFVPGDQPIWLVHHDATVQIGRIECSSGMVQDLGKVTRSRKQRLQWVETSSQSLEYVPSENPTFTWYGNDAVISRVENNLTPSVKIPAICDVTIPVMFRQFRLIPPSLSLSQDEEWPILIAVTMEAI